MSEEQNLFEAPTAVATPPSNNESGSEGDGGPGGSGGSKTRRRRRKRKSRPAGGVVGQVQAEGQSGGEGGSAEGSGFAEASPANSEGQPVSQNGVSQNSASQNGAQQNGAPQNGRAGNHRQHRDNASGSHGQSGGQGGGQGQGQAQGQGQGQGARRKKKKFRRAGEAGGQQRPEPGNSIQGSTSGMNGARRGRKQGSGGGGGSRGPRAFVGPMDHSYREANGNFADSPASTVMLQNNGHGRQNNGHRNGRHGNEDRLPPELMHHYRPVAIPEDAPTHIYFFIEDLFFTAKIQEVAKQQGVKVAFMKPDKDVVAHLAELHDHEHPSLIVFDLNNVAAKPLTLIPKLKNKLKKGTSILGFLSHLQGDLKQKAVEAGCHTVMPRSAFSQNLPNLLRRYGVEEGEEQNFNQ